VIKSDVYINTLVVVQMHYRKTVYSVLPELVCNQHILYYIRFRFSMGFPRYFCYLLKNGLKFFPNFLGFVKKMFLNLLLSEVGNSPGIPLFCYQRMPKKQRNSGLIYM